MKRTFAILAALLILTGREAAAAAIAVYHTSDAHGWYSARPALWDNENSTRVIGGFAALSALLKKETVPISCSIPATCSRARPKASSQRVWPV